MEFNPLTTLSNTCANVLAVNWCGSEKEHKNLVHILCVCSVLTLSYEVSQFEAIFWQKLSEDCLELKGAHSYSLIKVYFEPDVPTYLLS